MSRKENSYDISVADRGNENDLPIADEEVMQRELRRLNRNDGNPIDAFPETAKRVRYKRQYNKKDEDEGHEASTTYNDGVTLTEQHHKEDVDLNIMMERMGVTSRDKIPNVPISPDIADFTEVVDLKDAMDRVLVAKEQFAALPAKLRERFGNDPAKLFKFVTDRNNIDEAVSLGLLQRVRERDKVDVKTNTPPEKEKTPPAATAPETQKNGVT